MPGGVRVHDARVSRPMRPESAERAVNAYYESEAALRMVATELGALCLLAEVEAPINPDAPPPEPADAAAGLMAAFDRALALIAPGYPHGDDEQCDHLVVRRALEFEVGAILTALTGETVSSAGAPRPH